MPKPTNQHRMLDLIYAIRSYSSVKLDVRFQNGVPKIIAVRSPDSPVNLLKRLSVNQDALLSKVEEDLVALIKSLKYGVLSIAVEEGKPVNFITVDSYQTLIPGEIDWGGF